MRILPFCSLGLILASLGFADILCKRKTDGIVNKKIETPPVSTASVEAAAQVDKTGRQLLAGSPFLGVEVAFQTLGGDEPELFHRDATGLFVSESLVKKCKSKDQLAALLASEIGQMVAESRRTEQMQLPEPIPVAALGNKLDGTTDFDPPRAMELAKFDQARGKRPPQTVDPRTIAKKIMAEAGYDPKALDEVAPLLKEASKNHAIAKQFNGRGAEPRWTN